MITTSYKDANLYHDYATGRSVSGVLHFINSTPVDWFTKKQSTVETATYGSEFVAARIAVDQIIDLRLTLRYLGIPIDGRSYLFGDNESVTKSANLPQSALKKRHVALSFHRVREAVASDWLIFAHIPGDHNPADILSKHWGYHQVWSLMRPILFLDRLPGPHTTNNDGKGSIKITPRISGADDRQTAREEETVIEGTADD